MEPLHSPHHPASHGIHSGGGGSVAFAADSSDGTPQQHQHREIIDVDNLHSRESIPAPAGKQLQEPSPLLYRGASGDNHGDSVRPSTPHSYDTSLPILASVLVEEDTPTPTTPHSHLVSNNFNQVSPAGVTPMQTDPVFTSPNPNGDLGLPGAPPVAVPVSEPVVAVEYLPANPIPSNQIPKAVAQARPAQWTDFLENRNLQIYLVGFFCLVVVVTVLVSVLVSTSNNDSNPETLPPSLSSILIPPSLSPTFVPSDSPTIVATPTPTLPPGLRPTTTPLVLELPPDTVQAIQDPSSPQAQAYAWLAAHPQINSLAPFQKEQIMAFLTIYYSLNGDASFWGSEDSSPRGNFASYDVPFCQWTPFQDSLDNLGRCNDLRQLTLLNLHSVDGGTITSRRQGTLPNEISLLTHLTVLQIVNNDFTGFDVINFLPTTIVNLTNLKKLQYDFNNFEGTIPTSLLGGLTQLTSLSFDSNVLDGRIPTDIFDLRNLTFLSLVYNSLSGTIPTEVGQLTNLRTLRLYTNKLTAPFPSEQIMQLTKLSKLELQANAITGSLPSGFCTALSRLISLRLDCHLLQCAPDCTCNCNA